MFFGKNIKKISISELIMSEVEGTKNQLFLMSPRISLAILVRLLLIGESSFALFLTLCIMDNYTYLAMAFHVIVSIIEIFYTCIINKGGDFKWYFLILLSHVI